MMNPNFPDHLDINPSIFQFSSLEEPQLTNVPSDATLFGDSAQRSAIKQYGIAGRVWEAAYALSLYVSPPSTMKFDPPFVKDASPPPLRTMLELGSGTGIVSSYVAKTFNMSSDLIIATDLPEVCPLLENNLKKYKPLSFIQNASSISPNIQIRPLSWGNEEHCRRIINEFLVEQHSQPSRRLSHILCSDLVYFPELLGPLLRTLITLTSTSYYPQSTPNIDVKNGPVVIISYKIRSLPKETPFWSAFGLWFEFEPVLATETPGGQWQRFGQTFGDDMIFVFAAHRRNSSFTWKIPMNDQELLDGRGAWGDNTVKGDDTFETLLFMTLEES